MRQWMRLAGKVEESLGPLRAYLGMFYIYIHTQTQQFLIGYLPLAPPDLLHPALFHSGFLLGQWQAAVRGWRVGGE